MTLYGCNTSCSTLATNLASGSALPPTFSWEWAGASPVSTDTFLQVKGIDQAGKGVRTSGTMPLFTVFDPTLSGATPAAVSCGPDNQSGTQPCLVLADGAPNGEDIAGDPQAGDVQINDPNNTQGLLFSGYSDPCMRADSVVSASNPYGSNVFLTYSYPVLNQSTVNGALFYSQGLEIRLASSDTGLPTSTPSGQAWCAGGPTTCGTETSLFPSVEVSTSPPTFSSHEVSNIWEVPNYPSSGTTSWFAVHLAYWIVPPTAIPQSIMSTTNPGCLVVSSAQGSPANLAWTGTQPASCSGISGSLGVPLTFANLTSWANLPTNTCASWGQPAIMVTNSIVPQGATGSPGDYYMYLAAACLDSHFDVLNYYVLYTDYTQSQSLQSWNVAAGPFNLRSVSTLHGFPGYSNPVYITEFDWFARPDGSIGAIFTPVTQPVPGGPIFENGCLAANFNPVAGSTNGTANNPFSYQVSNSNIIANVTDMDSSGYNGTSETPGSGSCAYDPISNTGVIQVRRLVATLPNCTQDGKSGPAACPYNIYTLVDSGVVP